MEGMVKERKKKERDGYQETRNGTEEKKGW